MFTLNRESLSAALSMAQLCLEPKGTIPALAFALIEAKGGAISLYATDLDVSLTTTVEGEAEDGALCVPARQLKQLVSLFYGDTVTIIAKETGGRVRVQCGNAKHFLPSLDREHYPNIEGVEGKQFPIKGETLRLMLERTAFAICTEESRYSINGVYLETKGGKLLATATDQMRLAHIKTPIQFSEELSALVPRRAVAAILKAFTDDNPIFMKFGQDKMQFTQGATSITTRTLLGQFPNYQMIIPADRQHHFILNENATSVIKRAALTARMGIANNSPEIFFDVSREGIAISSADRDLGETEDRIDVPCETLNGSSVRLGVASKQVLELLAREPEIDFGFEDSDKPFKLTPTGLREYEYVYVMSPVRV